MSFQIFDGVYKTFKDTKADLAMFSSHAWKDHELASFYKDDGYALTPILLGMSLYNKNINILDWGGSLGRSKNTFKRASKIPVKFEMYDLNTNPPLRKEYDIIHFGSVLQYIENLEEIKLPKTNAILISDAMVSRKTFVTVQDWHGWKLPFKFRKLQDYKFSGFKIKSVLSYEPTVQGVKGFYDTKNLPNEFHPIQSCTILLIK